MKTQDEYLEIGDLPVINFKVKYLKILARKIKNPSIKNPIDWQIEIRKDRIIADRK